jgi:hypothetical protein
MDKYCIFCNFVFKSDFPPPGNRKKNKGRFRLIKEYTPVTAVMTAWQYCLHSGMSYYISEII